MLIEAATELNINLKIAGNGPLLSELINKANKNIGFWYKSGNELYNLISNSFCYTTSQCYENNPLSNYRIFSFGKPVIVSILGIPELLSNREFYSICKHRFIKTSYHRSYKYV